MLNDIQHAKLVIKDCIFENNIRIHVMEPSIILHSLNRDFIGPNGIIYEKSTSGCSCLSDDPHSLVEYRIEFADQDLILPTGTIITLGKEKWRCKLPACKAVKLEYRSSVIPINLEEPEKKVYDGIEFAVYSSGKIALYKPKSDYLPNNEMNVSMHIEKEIAETYMNEMLRCVSEVDCYQDRFCDDTAREFSILFEDGTELRYDGGFCHSETNTVDITNSFVKKCQEKLNFKYHC